MQIIEDYKKIGKQCGFLFESMVDNRTFISPSDRMLNIKHCMLSKNDMVYFASDSYAAKVGMSNTYSGVYSSIPSSGIDFNAEINKHFWYDFIAGRRSIRTNDSFLDKHLSITTNSSDQLLRIVDGRIARNYLELWDKYSPVKIVVGVDYLQSVTAFNGKFVIGIELSEWVLPEKFEATFNDLQGIVSDMILKLKKW